MFKSGDDVAGYFTNDQGREEFIVGEFLFRTNDPEKSIQDIVLLIPNGPRVYIDEQNARLYKRPERNGFYA